MIAARPCRSVDARRRPADRARGGRLGRVRRVWRSPTPSSTSTRATHIAAALDDEMLGPPARLSDGSTSSKPADEPKGLVDWGLAERIAVRIAGDGAPAGRATAIRSEGGGGRGRSRRREAHRLHGPRAADVAAARRSGRPCALVARAVVTLRDIAARPGAPPRRQPLAPGPARPGHAASRAGARPARRPGPRSATPPAACSASTTSRSALAGTPRLLFVGRTSRAAHADLDADPDTFLDGSPSTRARTCVQFDAVAVAAPTHMSRARRTS